jgi:hypothetical protein
MAGKNSSRVLEGGSDPVWLLGRAVIGKAEVSGSATVEMDRTLLWLGVEGGDGDMALCSLCCELSYMFENTS